MRSTNNIACINDITLVGEVVSSPEVASTYSGTTLYSVYFSTQRSSSITDTLQIIVKSDMVNRLTPGVQRLICGEIRTTNQYDVTKHKNKLVVYVFVKDVVDVEECEYNVNVAIIDGYLCKEPVIRTTNSGKTVCDILLAVNGRYGKSYYLPAVAFNDNAKYLAHKQVGDRVVVSGRLQSREYEQNNKKYTVFELFISNIRGFTND